MVVVVELKTATFHLSAETLGAARQFVVETANQLNLGAVVDLQLMEIAVGEVFQNIVRYAFENSGHEGSVIIQVGNLGEIASVTVIDESEISVENGMRAKVSDSTGGFGLGMIKASTQGQFVRRALNQNRLTLFFAPKHHEVARESITWAGRVIELKLEGASLPRLAREVVEHQGISEYGHLVETAINAIETWESLAVPVPTYHNTSHFRDVLIAVDHLCDSHDDLPLAQRTALILSALLHDFKHPGSRVIEGFDSIEIYSESEIRALYSSESLTTSELNIIDEVCEIVLSTRDPKATIHLSPNGLNSLFNVADSSASFIPWLGQSISEQILDELGESGRICPSDFYRGFIDTWREIGCPPEAAMFTAWIHPNRLMNAL